jgi:hypothetical protein
VAGENEIFVSFGNGFAAFPASNHPAAHFLPAVRARHHFGAICQPIHNQLLANLAHRMRPAPVVAIVAAKSIHPLACRSPDSLRRSIAPQDGFAHHHPRTLLSLRDGPADYP